MLTKRWRSLTQSSQREIWFSSLYVNSNLILFGDPEWYESSSLFARNCWVIFWFVLYLQLRPSSTSGIYFTGHCRQYDVWNRLHLYCYLNSWLTVKLGTGRQLYSKLKTGMVKAYISLSMSLYRSEPQWLPPTQPLHCRIPTHPWHLYRQSWRQESWVKSTRPWAP